MKTNNHLVTIDPQNDFCHKDGALSVPGADEDMKRLAKFVARMSDQLDEIHCTLDSHQTIHIAHPIFWVNSKGDNPPPFTLITEDAVESGEWRTKHPGLQAHALNYVKTLTKNNRYQLCIWPPHCRIASWGYQVVPELYDQFAAWETNTFSKVDFVVKGSNFLTEHYSAVMADFQCDDDPTTKINTKFLDVLSKADVVYFTGEALSHCVANTVVDIADNFGEDNIKKIVLLEDTTSNVPGFEALGSDFLKKLTARGMRTAKSTDI